MRSEVREKIKIKIVAKFIYFKFGFGMCSQKK
jgi:hypothetical protein